MNLSGELNDWERYGMMFHKKKSLYIADKFSYGCKDPIVEIRTSSIFFLWVLALFRIKVYFVRNKRAITKKLIYREIYIIKKLFFLFVLGSPKF